MGVFVRKIHCPNPEHKDTNPSCALYADGSAYCFGCNRAFQNVEAPVTAPAPVKEDLSERLDYIKTLPTQQIRGLELPYDNIGYYLVWPSNDYYKCRRFLSDSDSGKYLNPRGHTQPPFILNKDSREQLLIIVEGEMNALSINRVLPNICVVSPGGSSQFKSKLFKNYLRSLKPGYTILILTDRDSPGLDACLTTAHFLSSYPGLVIKHLMQKDCNDILVTYGAEKLTEEIEKMGMPGRV